VISLLKRLFRYSTAGPALTRYYIMPRVKLHHIHQSDADFHTHPWNGLSIIFGRYKEYRGTDPVLRTRWFVNRVYAHIPHKVIIDRPVFTLFMHGRRINDNWTYGESTKPWEGSDQERERGMRNG
jgi:hypothetical protein